MWRGTGRRRLPDALEAARREARTYKAACDSLQDERDQLERRLASLEETNGYQATSLEQARTENADLRRALRAKEQELADAEAEIRRQEQRATALWSQLANARPIRVPAPADAGCRDEAAAEETAATDVSQLREQAAHLLLLAPGPNGETPCAAVDDPGAEEPTVAMPVALDAEDTVTLPRPLLAPIAHVQPIPPKPAHAPDAPTVPVVTLAQGLTPTDLPTLPPEFATTT